MEVTAHHHVLLVGSKSQVCPHSRRKAYTRGGLWGHLEVCLPQRQLGSLPDLNSRLLKDDQEVIYKDVQLTVRELNEINHTTA